MTQNNPALASKAPNNTLPDTGEVLPTVAWATVALFIITLAVGIASSLAWLNGELALLATIAINAAVCFVMFTVLHDASHHSAGSSDLANEILGRFSMLFVSAAAPFAVLRYIHIEHHRNTNEHEDGRDPDAWCSEGPKWQQPLRWFFMDIRYLAFWFKRARSRPRAEQIETAITLSSFIGGLIWAYQAGIFWELSVIYLIPNRLAIFTLIWWFDWLPHVGLNETSRSNRFQATRNRIGAEWFLTPLMLSQNYHLVHHLHPSVPFYAYRRVWLRNEEAYLRQGSALSDVWGNTLNNNEYRAWRGLPAVAAETSTENNAAERAQFHPLKVAELRQLTADSMAVTFEVPEGLAETFRFRQGQHLTVRCDIRGEKNVRRNYSICNSVNDGKLKIGVKHIPNGAFSSHVMNDLAIGDQIEVMPPSGRFFTQLSANHAKSYVLIAAGSGITPILSILKSTLEVEQESKCILLYGNKTADNIMFKDELQKLKLQYPDRFQLLHFLSQQADVTQQDLSREQSLGWPRTDFDHSLLNGRINGDKIEQLLGSYAKNNRIDDWFICGPQEMVDDIRSTLDRSGVTAEQIHFELFAAAAKQPPSHQAASNFVAATVTVTAGGKSSEFNITQPEQTLLDAALETRGDIPYSCMGGACGSCRAKLESGTVEMDQNFALDEAELAAGYVLTCQCHPTSSEVALNYDA